MLSRSVLISRSVLFRLYPPGSQKIRSNEICGIRRTAAIFLLNHVFPEPQFPIIRTFFMVLTKRQEGGKGAQRIYQSFFSRSLGSAYIISPWK